MKRVIVADDSKVARLILARVLMQSGLEVDQAKDGREVVEQVTDAEDGTYGIIFMDLNMPEMDGLKATRKLRRLEQSGRQRITIIGISGSNESERMDFKDAGADRFLDKPVNASDIASMLRILGYIT